MPTPIPTFTFAPRHNGDKKSGYKCSDGGRSKTNGKNDSGGKGTVENTKTIQGVSKTDGKNDGGGKGNVDAKKMQKGAGKNTKTDFDCGLFESHTGTTPRVYTCKNKAFHKCNFTGCQGIQQLILQGKQLTGTLPEALQNLNTLGKLCVETALYIFFFVQWEFTVLASTRLHITANAAHNPNLDIFTRTS